MSSGSSFPHIPSDTPSPQEHYRAASSRNLTSSPQSTATTTTSNNIETEERRQQVIKRVKLKLKEDRDREVERQRLESQRVYEQIRVNEEKAARLKAQVNERLARRIQVCIPRRYVCTCIYTHHYQCVYALTSLYSITIYVCLLYTGGK